MSRLLLGPIVGHTDHESTRIWIRVQGDPADFTLRISGVASRIRFQSTEAVPEFGTAVALVTGLRAEREYKYHILRRGRTVPHGRGSLRTMPEPGSMADMLFAIVSCCHNQEPTNPLELGAWTRLRDYIKQAKPRFLLMIGDQVYQDDSIDAADGRRRHIWERHLDGGYRNAKDRRRALAETYQKNWSLHPIREVLANIPVYMMWDDHDIRDGWGSWASESETLKTRYPRGEGIFNFYREYFNDCKDVFWHFQRSSYYPLSAASSTDISSVLPVTPFQGAMPVAFRCGRLAVLILDGRGERDLWRESNPVLGDAQWRFIDGFLSTLPPDIDALTIVTPVPIVATSPENSSQKMLGDRNDDVEFFKRGDLRGLRELQGHSGEDMTAPVLLLTFLTPPLLGGSFSNSAVAYGRTLHWKDDSIDEARDQWCNHFSRPEQERLIRKAVAAAFTNRPTSQPRGVFFVGGDLHSGGLITISVDRPDFKMQCLITSGISRQNEGVKGMVGVLVDDEFEVASGIRASLDDYTLIYNFGVTHIVFTGGTPVIKNVVARQGDDQYMALNIP